MARPNYGAGKRAREAEKARKKRDKAERRRRKRDEGPTEIPVASADEVAVAALSTDPDAAAAEGGTQEKRTRTMPVRLFVGGLAWETESDVLRKAFEAHGNVLKADVIMDRDGRSRGFGFVTMGDPKSAKAAMAGLDGAELDGRNLKVSPATDS